MLNLEDGCVKDFEIFKNSYIIYIELKRKAHYCPRCHNLTDKIKDYRTQKIMAAHINSQPVYAAINRRRYQCPICNKAFIETTPFIAPYQRRTKSISMQIINECSKKQSFTEIAKRFSISTTTVIRYFSKISYPVPAKLPEVIAIDEFKGNAQGQKYQVALVDPIAKKPLDILPKRDTEELIHYFSKNFTYKQRCAVNLVVTDLSALFRKVIKTVFPKAKIVGDRYHIIRLVNWAMERVRKRVQNEAGKERIYFKRSKRLINKNIENLTKEDLIRLEDMLSKSKDLGHAYLLKEAFRRVLKKDVIEKATVLRQWLDLVQESNLGEFRSILTTFNDWREEIVRGLVSKHSNGYIEGHNNKIKVIKRLSFGIKTFNIFRNRVLYAE